MDGEDVTLFSIVNSYTLGRGLLWGRLKIPSAISLFSSLSLSAWCLGSRSMQKGRPNSMRSGFEEARSVWRRRKTWRPACEAVIFLSHGNKVGGLPCFRPSNPVPMPPIPCIRCFTLREASYFGLDPNALQASNGPSSTGDF